MLPSLGPWTRDERIIRDVSGHVVCTCARLKDAKLIQQAPELLRVLDSVEGAAYIHNDADLVVARANGQATT